MASREFADEGGRNWMVWDVRPIVKYQSHAKPNLSHGWLAFECGDGERRRLAPIPDDADGWAVASDDQLRSWCALAQGVRRAKD